MLVMLSGLPRTLILHCFGVYVSDVAQWVVLKYTALCMRSFFPALSLLYLANLLHYICQAFLDFQQKRYIRLSLYHLQTSLHY